MTDYIKREDAKELFYTLLEHYHDTGVEVIKHTAAIAPKEFHVSEADDIADFNSEINGWKNGFSAIPSADVAPVRRGRWIECTSSPHWKCSMCGTKASIWFDEFDEICEWLSDYCPNCGAKMDGDADD